MILLFLVHTGLNVSWFGRYMAIYIRQGQVDLAADQQVAPLDTRGRGCDASITENVPLGELYQHTEFHAFNTKCTTQPKNVINLLDYSCLVTNYNKGDVTTRETFQPHEISFSLKNITEISSVLRNHKCVSIFLSMLISYF